MKAVMANGGAIEANVSNEKALITIKENSKNTYIQLEKQLPFDCDGSEYVLFPACSYNGNRFDSLKKNYPPLLSPQEASPDVPVIITDVPRLEKDGSGIIEVTSGDVSVPCVGVYSKEKGKAVLVYTIGQIEGRNLGLAYVKGNIMLRWPFFREDKAYRWPFMVDSTDKGRDFSIGESFEIEYKVFEFDCDSMEQFFRVFFENRKCMGMDSELPSVLSDEEQWELQRDKFNYLNWYYDGGFYGHTSKADGVKYAWQPGWCGGSISSYAMLKLGGKLEEKRAMMTLEHMYRTQKPCGILVDSTDFKGNQVFRKREDDSKHWHLTRESADALYFTIKHFEIFKERGVEIPQEVLSGAKKLADKFVSLFEQYGQIGQFVHMETGELMVGNSTSAGVLGAAMCKAHGWFGDEKYMKLAVDVTEQYYTRDAANGYTTGGPGEILAGPDSESCAGLLESLVELYETTKEPHWLEKAKHVAHMCASWTMSYNYNFPPHSEFYRLDMKTIGTIFANVQNKHSAPGICTLSGDSLYRLWKHTGDALYHELYKDITVTVSQFMSTDARPVYSWDVPKDASLLNDDTLTVPPEKLLPGYICERVNTSDWESFRCVGGVFNGSTWAEVSNLLILAECSSLIGRQE